MRLEVGGIEFACDLASVVEVIFPPKLSHPPTVPDVIKGFADIGGVMIAVLRMDCLLGVEYKKPHLYQHIIRLSGQYSFAALLVDRVQGAFSINETDIMPLKCNGSFNDCIAAEIKTATGDVHELSIERLFTAYEQRQIESLINEEARRKHIFETVTV